VLVRFTRGADIAPIGERKFGAALGVGLGLLVVLGCAERIATRSAQAQARVVPTWEVDPSWPSLPRGLTLGQVSGVAVDSRDHVWIVQRPWSLTSDEQAQNPEAECCRPGPPVMEFTPDGRYVQGWGGPGDGYEWPADEHGIHVDAGDNVWVSSAGGPRLAQRVENQLLKFSRDGTFLLQIGRRGASQGSLDTENLNNAADMFVHAPTGELFVADGYVNRRVAVFDAGTGAFRRMWGAYGNEPDDDASHQLAFDGPAPQQFNTVHGIAVSDDGRVYVADRLNNRVQVFTLAGDFEAEAFIERPTRLLGTAFSVAFSEDPAQRFLLVADGGNGKVHVLDRGTLEQVTEFGRIGRYAGQFVFLHNVAVDSRGDVYTAEVGTGRRVQKFVRR
jgi:DNA-binding beta-propeller fold protein YncE